MGNLIGSVAQASPADATSVYRTTPVSRPALVASAGGVVAPPIGVGVGATGIAPTPTYSARPDRASGAVLCGGDGVAYYPVADPIDYSADMFRKVRRPRHLIADIHYEPHNGPSWMECSCGTRLNSDNPEALKVMWRTHGGKVQRDG